MVESHETSPLTTQLASFRQWGRPPGLQPDPLVGFGRASGLPTVRPRSQPPELGFVSPTVSGLRPKPQGQPPLTGNWLRLVKSRPVGQASRPVHPNSSLAASPSRLRFRPPGTLPELASFCQPSPLHPPNRQKKPFTGNWLRSVKPLPNSQSSPFAAFSSDSDLIYLK
jgi:hypothetical protein